MLTSFTFVTSYFYFYFCHVLLKKLYFINVTYSGYTLKRKVYIVFITYIGITLRGNNKHKKKTKGA